MTDPTTPNRERVSRNIVVPTAIGVEGFLWRVAWFALFVKVLFF